MTVQTVHMHNTRDDRVLEPPSTYVTKVSVEVSYSGISSTPRGPRCKLVKIFLRVNGDFIFRTHKQK